MCVCVCASCVCVCACVCCVCVCVCVCVLVCETYRGRMVSRSLSSAGLEVSALRLAMTARLPPQLTPTRPKAASYEPLVVFLRLPRGFFSPHSDRVSAACVSERVCTRVESTKVNRHFPPKRRAQKPIVSCSEEQARERERETGEHRERGG